MSALAEKPQALRALDRAQEIRMHRVALQRAIANGHLTVALVLFDEDDLTQESIRKLRVAQLLAWKRGIADSRAERMLRRIGISAFLQVGALSRARRREVAELVG